MIDQPVVARLLDVLPLWRNRTILRSADGSLTFDELSESMLRHVGWLSSELSIRPGDRVAICLPKGLGAAKVIYGVLAAGATYVPLQFRGPPARLAGILRSIQPHLLLTTGEMWARLGALDDTARSLRVVTIEDNGRASDFEPMCSGSATATALPEVDADGTAAIYFTSGSTGEPKGVMLSHRSIATTLAWVRESRREEPSDRLISLAALQYVASIELFFPLLSGSSQFLLSETEAMFPERIASAIEQEQITQLLITATALRLLFEGGSLERRDLRSLRRVEFFGEPLAVPLLRQIMETMPTTEFVNIYGATEAYDIANYTVPRCLPEDLQTLPLGKPNPQYELTLRNDAGAVVAPGEVGEICVVGPQVMSGYWNDPELSAARRIEDRADSYRTGDLAVMDHTGLLRLLGRTDRMIKVRGHRLDLGEVEATLKAHVAVRDAAALVNLEEDGEQQIHVLVLAQESEALVDDLARHCRERLPRYAQPARISLLARFPLLPTGKVDRRALKNCIVHKTT